MKAASIFFAALFALGAAVQTNDPDPLIWIAGYGIAAGLSIAAALGRRLFLPNVVAAVVFGVWFVTIASSLIGAPKEAFTSFEMQAKTHEEPREAGGLALLTGWSTLLAVAARRSQRVEDSY